MENKETLELLEKLAELEHEQWIYWSKALAENTMIKIPQERLDRWKKLWIPYSDLSEADKEHDRKWARKVIEIFKELLNGVKEDNG